jgi:hypothetical protein
MGEALEQARLGRLHIMEKIVEAIPSHRTDISQFAPRIYTMKIPTDKIRDVIGPGGSPQLDDHIPFILDNFVAMVRGENETCSTNAKSDADQNTRDHGLMRWQQGYELHQLTIEWGHLHLVLLEELESFPHPGLDPGSDVMARVRRLLAVLCTDGVSESAERYWRLHQAEASGQVRDLEATLKRVSVAEITRAESWREAAHDIRGTFGSVELATLLVDDPSSAQDRQENIELLKQNVSSMRDMLNELLDLARLEAGQDSLEVTPFDSSTVLMKLSDNLLYMHQYLRATNESPTARSENAGSGAVCATRRRVGPPTLRRRCGARRGGDLKPAVGR